MSAGRRYELAVRGGTLVGPQGRAELDVYVDDGKVAALVPPSERRPAERELDASGLLVLPGGVDTHVHFMDPGDPSREDFPTGSAAAATRGVTTVVEHTHGRPVTDPEQLAEKLAHLDGRSHVDYGLAAHVWPDRLDRLPELWTAGVTYFKAFTCETHGVPAIDAATMMRLARTLVEIGAPCLVHCEDDHLTATAERELRAAHRADGGIVPAWRSREAELVSVSMVAAVARRTGARMVVAHASNVEVLDLIDRERAAGADLVAESCPQYLHLHEDEVLREGAFRKFTPPARIRSEIDERQMWERLESGSIHHLSSDHAPATREQKQDGDIWKAHFGLPGVDTTYPIMAGAALAGRTSLERVVEAYCELPARLYGIRGKGKVEPGFDADLALLDPSAGWSVSDEDVISKAGWTPYAGRELRGRFVATVLRGTPIAEGASPAGQERQGRFLPGAGAR
jgi:dihydroorotase (multifunctional complex type)